MAKLYELIISCNTQKEAEFIGDKLLGLRLVPCYDIISRISTNYYWPPKSNRIVNIQGCILIAPTKKLNYKKIEKETRKIHSDKIPFIGLTAIEMVNADYLKWFKSETK